MKNILVTGGAGYIGSFIVRELQKEGYNPVIFDNFSSGHKLAVSGFDIVEGNLLTDPDTLDETFKNYVFAGVIHMSGLIQVGESYRNPGKYFSENIGSTINLLEMMVKHEVNNIVFSSSAGVYGSPKDVPIPENADKNPENPYGDSKLMIEKILKWYDKAYGLRSVSIRYFNAAGAALDGSLGEDHPDESHLIPVVIKSALAEKKFVLFGGDYDTKDGTCVRDYVHVIDLSKAHTGALTYLSEGGETVSLNAGIGKGYTNMEVVKEIEKHTGPIAVEIGNRRPGDADKLVASVDKIKKALKWEPIYNLSDIVSSAYKWHHSHPEGFLQH